MTVAEISRILNQTRARSVILHLSNGSVMIAKCTFDSNETRSSWQRPHVIANFYGQEVEIPARCIRQIIIRTGD